MACRAITISHSRRMGEKGWVEKLWRNFAERWTRAMTSAQTFRKFILATYPSRKRERGSIATFSPIHFHAKTCRKQENWLEWKREAAQGRGLLWEVERLLEELKESESRPDVLLMENVPGVCGDRNLKPWNEWLDRLEELGYSSYWAKVNAKDHGIPQNRLRVFMVSILGEYGYHFPKKRKLTKRLRDLLEENPDKKYNLSPRIIETMLYGDSKGFDRKVDFENSIESGKKGVARTLKAKGSFDSGWTVVTECLNPKVNGKQPSLGNRVYSDGGLSTCVTTSPFFMGKILVKNATKKGYLEADEGDGIDCGTRMQYHRGTVQSGMSQTIKTTIDIATQSEGKLRKLTPLECMRLMGFNDKDEQAMRSIGMRDSAIYHCAGDSIVVDVLMDIFKELL